MPPKKPAAEKPAARGSDNHSANASGTVTSARSTVSAPARSANTSSAADAATARMEGAQQLAAGMPFNPTKRGEYGQAAATPQPGATAKPADPRVTGSSLTESILSPKVGAGKPNLGFNPASLPLDRVRVDSSDQVLTTNQGVPVADNQNSLKAGLRGPTLLEDFILREKITHFDHERIPERIVHARGSAAHGYFECYAPMTEFTRASLFAEAGKRTPVFVRFSTVAGERGSTDTARDVRGFAVKFYTDEGNWDLVGNNIPVFFIQDAMKFPDLIHAVKPEPHFGMPQAATAHDTFWDFVSLMPESTHMLMWAMSDRAMPRSYRMMQGFGVHTFRLVNDEGESTFVKFHWRPVAGTHSLVWDEAVKIAGADPDFHRRDLWEAIEAGAFPEWELGLQIFTRGAGRELQLRRPRSRPSSSPRSWCRSRRSAGWCSTAIPTTSSPRPSRSPSARRTSCPGIDFTNDPLLGGPHPFLRRHADLAAGRPELPRDPDQRAGRARCTTTSATACTGRRSIAARLVRAQFARRRLSVPGRRAGLHLLSRADRRRQGARQAGALRRPLHAGDAVLEEPDSDREGSHHARLSLRADQGASPGGARARGLDACQRGRRPGHDLAAELGMDLPAPMPKASRQTTKPEIEVSPALSLFAQPGDGSIRTRRIAILVADGVDGEAARTLHAGLLAQGAVPRYVGPRLGAVQTDLGDTLQVEVTLETMPSVLFDAVAVPGGNAAVVMLGNVGHALEFIKDQYRHAKPILALGAGADLVENAGASPVLPSGDADPGMLVGRHASAVDALPDFIVAVGRHRHHEREMDPPAV